MRSWRAKIWILSIIMITLVGFGVYYMIDWHFQADSLSEEYTLFHKDNFESVVSESVPEPGEEITTGSGLSVYATKGEIEPATFSVRSNIDLGSVGVSVTDLTSGGNIIPASSIEILNEKIWEQCSLVASSHGKCNDPTSEWYETINVPELLVKDSEQDIATTEAGWNGSEYIAPSLNQDFFVKVEANSTHTFYLRIKIPDDAASGIYSGTVTFAPENGSASSFDLNLEVLSFSLPDSSKGEYVFFDKEPNGSGGRAVSREVYSQYLQLFIDSGVTGIVVYPPTDSETMWIADELERLGFEGVVVIEDNYRSNLDYIDIQAAKSYFESKGYSTYFFGFDEPWNSKDMVSHLKESKIIHDAGGKVITDIRKECSDAMLDSGFSSYYDPAVIGAKIEPVEKVDYPWYSMVDGAQDWCLNSGSDSLVKTTIVDYINGLYDGSVTRNSKLEGFYKNIFPEHSSYNRNAYGNFLWATGLDSAAAYGVEGYYPDLQGTKQYDDFDSPKKSSNSLYRSSEGPVLTLQWEGFREGIDDSRYLTKLDMLINKLEKTDATGAASIRAELKNVLSAYRYGSRAPWLRMGDDANQNVRDWVKSKIIMLIDQVGDEDGVCGDGICHEGEKCAADCSSSDNPSAAWNFDENRGYIVEDKTGINDGELKNFSADSWADQDCVLGSCLNFNGDNNYVFVPEDPTLDATSELTVAGWIKPADVYPGGAIALKDGSYGIHIYQNNIYFDTWNSSGQRNIEPHYEGFNASEWIHVAGVYDSGSKKLYINGELASDQDVTTPYASLVNSSEPLYIGKHWADSYFDGTIDDLHIYRSALSQDEIINLMNGNIIEIITCSDGIQNGDETGIDCGGTCGDCEPSHGDEPGGDGPVSGHISYSGEQGAIDPDLSGEDDVGEETSVSKPLTQTGENGIVVALWGELVLFSLGKLIIGFRRHVTS